MSILNNETTFGSFAIGTVLQVDRDTRRVAVHIAKFMPGIPGEVAFASKSPTITEGSVNIVGVQEVNPLISIRNSIWVNAWNYDNPLPKEGSKVAVSFIDDNPKNGYWNPFNPNDSYEVIDEEKFRSIFSLRVSGRTIDVKEEDRVVIDFPNSFSASLSEVNKTKTISLIKQENYVISDIEPANPFEGMMWNNNERLFLYKEGRFVRMILDEDMRDVYSQLDELSKALSNVIISDRLFFIRRFEDVKNPFDQQIVAVDPTRTGVGFFIFKQVVSEENYENEDGITVSNGIYYLTYSNLLTEVSTGEEVVLEAYRYYSSTNQWEKLDGWWLWNQPNSIGNLESTVATVNLPQTLSYTPTYNANPQKLKVSDIELFNPNIDNLHIEFFTTTTSGDVPIGLPFLYQKKWDSGVNVYTTEPSEPQNGDLWYDSDETTLFRYDITTLNWNDGEVLLTAEPEETVLEDGDLFVLVDGTDYYIREWESGVWTEWTENFQYGLAEDRVVATSENLGLYYFSTDTNVLEYVVEDTEDPGEYIWVEYTNTEYTIYGEEEPVYRWANGTRYYDEDNDVLLTFNIDRTNPEDEGVWIGEAVPSTAPTSPVLGDMYFDESINTLFTYVVVPSWVVLDDSVTLSEPSSPENGEQWLDVTLGKLFTYTEKFLVMFNRGYDAGVSIPTIQPQLADNGDTFFKIINEVFGVISTFNASQNIWEDGEEQISIIEPLESDISDGTKWFDTSDNKLYEYSQDWNDGEEVDLSEPSSPEIGDVYFDKTEGKLFTYILLDDDGEEVEGWDQGVPLPNEENIPVNPFLNSLYFDYTEDLLFKYVREVTETTMATSEVLSIRDGQLWFDTVDDELKRYNLEDSVWELVSALDTTASVTPSDGYQYFDESEGLLFTYSEKFDSQGFEATSLIVDGNNITIVVPDIRVEGIECSNIKCLIKKVGLPTAANLTLGEVTITAKSEIKEV